MRHGRIVSNPRVMFGRPVIAGTRIPAELVLRKLGAGLSEAEIIAQHPDLTADDVRAAAAFAADYLAGEEIVDANPGQP